MREWQGTISIVTFKRRRSQDLSSFERFLPSHPAPAPPLSSTFLPSIPSQVDGALVSSIGRGILVLVGVAHGDGPADVDWVARKLLSARLFPSPSEGKEDEEGGGGGGARWSSSVSDIPGGEILCVSQFTLLGSLKKGTKPDFKAAAPPAEAVETYRALLDRVREGFKEPGRVKDGVFGAMMKVEKERGDEKRERAGGGGGTAREAC